MLFLYYFLYFKVKGVFSGCSLYHRYCFVAGVLLLLITYIDVSVANINVRYILLHSALLQNHLQANTKNGSWLHGAWLLLWAWYSSFIVFSCTSRWNIYSLIVVCSIDIVLLLVCHCYCFLTLMVWLLSQVYLWSGPSDSCFWPPLDVLGYINIGGGQAGFFVRWTVLNWWLEVIQETIFFQCVVIDPELWLFPL